MNAGDMYPLFASMLTQRPWDDVTKQSLGHLSMPGTSEVCRCMHLCLVAPSRCDQSLMVLCLLIRLKRSKTRDVRNRLRNLNAATITRTAPRHLQLSRF